MIEPTIGQQAHADELAKLRSWGNEAMRLRIDRAVNEAKNSGAWDEQIALRDLQRQINEGQK